MSRTVEELPLFQDERERAFLEFHDKNPQVYALLVRLACEWKDGGGDKLGMKALFERARWEFRIGTTTTQPVLNNNYTPFYARLIMQREPALDGLFNLRERRAA